MQQPHLYPCLNCLNCDCVELKADKKGRPYTTCRNCGSRCFLHSAIALRGLTHFAPQLIALWRQATAASTLHELDTRVQAAQQAVATPAVAHG